MLPAGTRSGPAQRGAPARALEPQQARFPAQRILLIRLGALGDVVRTRFAFGGLRALYPHARIDWLVEDRAAPGLVGIRALDRIIELPRRELRWLRPARAARALAALVAELRAQRYDLSVDFHGILKSALLARAARIPVRVGFAPPLAREGSARLLTHAATLSASHLSRFERNAALVRWLGGEVPPGAPPLDVPPAEPWLGELGAYVLVHPGTSASTLYKRWDPARYAEVCRVLRERAGLVSLVTWGPVPGERGAAEAVVEAAGGSARLAPQTASAAQLLALMRPARLFVGSDSGPMHLASLAGLPIVAVFGPTDPLENAPFPGLPQRVVRHDVGCNPCREGCPARTCMVAVSADEVAAAALELLGAAG
jgi:ADP-heptose:LPS heptosyltransferase